MWLRRKRTALTLPIPPPPQLKTQNNNNTQTQQKWFASSYFIRHLYSWSSKPETCLRELDDLQGILFVDCAKSTTPHVSLRHNNNKQGGSSARHCRCNTKKYAYDCFQNGKNPTYHTNNRANNSKLSMFNPLSSDASASASNSCTTTSSTSNTVTGSTSTCSSSVSPAPHSSHHYKDGMFLLFHVYVGIHHFFNGP